MSNLILCLCISLFLNVVLSIVLAFIIYWYNKIINNTRLFHN